MARTITLHPTAGAAAQALAEAPGGPQLPGDLARGFLAFALELAARQRPLRLPTPSERLLLALEAAEAADLGVPAAAVGAFARSLSELHGSGLTPAQLRALGPRAERLARAFDAHRRRTTGAGLCDAAGVAAVAAEAVRAGAPLAFDALRVRPRLQWSASELDLLAALAERAAVAVALPEDAARLALFAPLDPVHQELMSSGRVALNGEAVAGDLDQALARALAGLFGVPDPTDAVAAVAYGSAADEARGVALGVRALLRAGVAPDSIAVTALVPPARQLRTALAAAGIPVGAAPEPLAVQSAAQVTVAFASAAAEGLPREALCELLEARALAVPDSRRWAQLLREAGSGDHRSGRLLPPLKALLSRMQVELRPLPEGLPALEAAVAAIASLPEEAPLPVHARRLWAALKDTGTLSQLQQRAERPPVRPAASRQLGLFDQTGAGPAVNDWEAPWVEVAGTEAAAAIGQVTEVLGAFESVPRRGGSPRSLLELVTLLTAAFEDTPRWQVPPLPGGVAVGSFDILAGRRFAHVFLTGLSGDGGGGAEDSFLPEGLREAARDTLARPAAFARSGAAAARAKERLMLVRAAALATESVRASGARTAEGKSLPPSPLLAELGRASSQGLRLAPLRPWPLLGVGALTRDEVAAALLLEPSASIVAAEVPALVVRHAALRAQRLGRERAIVEGGIDPYSGDFTALDLRPALAEALAFGAERPLSATTLDRLAGCGFRALANTVLRLRLPDERDEALDSRDRGTLSHRCLERGFQALRAADLLPLRGKEPGERRRREVEVFQAAVAAELAAAEASGQGGHPALWVAHRRHAEQELLAVLAAEQQRADSMVPSDFEIGFGAAAERPSPVLPLNAGQILLGGRVDRVDRGEHRLRVIDYKSGKIDHRRRRLLAEFADRDLQLGHYALAFSLSEPGVAVDAVYYSIKDADYSPSLAEVCAAAGTTVAAFLDADAGRRAVARAEGQPNLVNRIEDSLAIARAGQFPVAPGDCSYCDYRAACRVGRLYEEWE